MAEEQGCVAARDALAMARELRVDMNALQRRTDTIETDKNRLGDRVTANSDRMTDHETLTHKSVKQMNDTLDSLNDTVLSLKEAIAAAVAVPTVPTGVAMLEGWRATPTNAKVKLGGALTAILLAPEFLKPLIVTGFALIKRLFHLP